MNNCQLTDIGNYNIVTEKAACWLVENHGLSEYKPQSWFITFNHATSRMESPLLDFEIKWFRNEQEIEVQEENEAGIFADRGTWRRGKCFISANSWLGLYNSSTWRSDLSWLRICETCPMDQITMLSTTFRAVLPTFTLVFTPGEANPKNCENVLFMSLHQTSFRWRLYLWVTSLISDVILSQNNWLVQQSHCGNN